VTRGFNDDELAHLIQFGAEVGAEVRFIEYMDVGGATQWSIERVVSKQEILESLGRRFGPIQQLSENGTAPADRYTLPDGTVFGIIASTTDPFCLTCDRSRLTADGVWFLCLYAADGLDLRSPLREGASTDEIRQLIAEKWARRSDRGPKNARNSIRYAVRCTRSKTCGKTRTGRCIRGVGSCPVGNSHYDDDSESRSIARRAASTRGCRSGSASSHSSTKRP
jgi:molybdenum cofactor biosynthesis enzyme MoaA